MRMPNHRVHPDGELAVVGQVLRVRPFRRLWLVLGVSSVGDWMGLLATSTFAASQVGSPVLKGLAFGGVVAVRLLPALVLGPLAGVLADRFDRRHTLAACDLLRFALFASIPTVGLTVDDAGLVVGWTAVAIFVIEAVSLVWLPTKEAAVPNLLPRNRLEAANQLDLATTFGVTPVLAALIIAGLNGLAWLLFGSNIPLWADPTNAALFLNALTFAVNAAVVFFGIREISGRIGAAESMPRRGVLRDLTDGWTYIRKDPLVGGLTGGILVAMGGAGIVIGTANFYAVSLGGGDVVFYLLFGALFVGLSAGIIAGPTVVRELSRRRWFALSIALGGCSLIVFALAPHILVAIPACVLIGAAVGMALLAGWTMLGIEVADAIRGRVFAFVLTGCRIVLLLGITVSSVLAGAGGSFSVRVGEFAVSVSSTRILLLLTGAATVLAAAVVLHRIDDKPGTPVLTDLREALRRGKKGSGRPA